METIALDSRQFAGFARIRASVATMPALWSETCPLNRCNIYNLTTGDGFKQFLFSTRTFMKISILEYIKFSQLGWFDHHWYSTGWSVGGWSYTARSIRFYLTAPRGVDVYKPIKKDSSLFMEEIGVENLPFLAHSGFIVR